MVISCLVLFSAPAWGQQNQFQRWDKNRDGQLVVDELPERIRGNFGRVDRNQDGVITLEEHNRFVGRSRELPGTVHRDLAYVENGHARQKLDLYLPALESNKRAPLILFVHGGAWKSGDKKSVPAEEFLKAGFAVASINYRLSQHAVFPAQIIDCNSAVVWLRDHADRYHLDVGRIGAFGKSAGGHLVNLLGTHSHTAKGNGPGRVKAVCSWYGPTELLTMNAQSRQDSVIDHDANDSPESRLIGGALQDEAFKAKAASPTEYVSSDDASFLLMHGNRDRLVPYQQSEEFHRKLKESGVKSKLIIVPGAGHGLDRRKELPKVIEFFKNEFSVGT